MKGTVSTGVCNLRYEYICKITNTLSNKLYQSINFRTGKGDKKCFMLAISLKLESGNNFWSFSMFDKKEHLGCLQYFREQSFISF